MKPLFLAIVVSVAANAVGAEKPSGPVHALFQRWEQGQAHNEVFFFPKLGWSDIPVLLQYGRSNKVLTSFPRNPLSSQLELKCSEGMVALWLVEGVRQGCRFPSLNALCFAGAPRHDWTTESEANHARVLEAYRAWWMKSKNGPPADAAKTNPLSVTKLGWH